MKAPTLFEGAEQGFEDNFGVSSLLRRIKVLFQTKDLLLLHDGPLGHLVHPRQIVPRDALQPILVVLQALATIRDLVQGLLGPLLRGLHQAPADGRHQSHGQSAEPLASRITSVPKLATESPSSTATESATEPLASARNFVAKKVSCKNSGLSPMDTVFGCKTPSTVNMAVTFFSEARIDSTDANTSNDPYAPGASPPSKMSFKVWAACTNTHTSASATSLKIARQTFAKHSLAFCRTSLDKPSPETLLIAGIKTCLQASIV